MLEHAKSGHYQGQDLTIPDQAKMMQHNTRPVHRSDSAWC